MIFNDPEHEKKQTRKHVTISMIADVDPEVDGIQFVLPIVQCGTFIKLKHKMLITLAVNTCQRFTAVEGLRHGDCPNGDYSDELNYGVDHLSGGNNQSEFEERFFEGIRNVASSRIANNVFDDDVLKTLERLYPGRIKGTAFAFSGHDDNDNYGIIHDEKNRNPVERLYSDCGQIGARRQNSVGLTTLFSRDELDVLDGRIAEWLSKDGKNFFNTKETVNGKDKFVYPKYSFVYLLQSLLQVILADYDGKLSKLDKKRMLCNWNSFLNDLSDNSNEAYLFKEYKGDTDPNCPKNFVEFCLNKFLNGTDLLEEIKKDASDYELYTKASTDLSNCLRAALHANQVAAITVDAKNLSYDDYFIGADNFFYVPLRKAYRKIEKSLKSTLESLGGLFKYKPAKLDQTKVENKTLNDNEMKDTFGYNMRKVKEDVKDEKGQVIEKKDVVIEVVPKCYNPNISRDCFKKLMKKIEEYNKINDNQFLKLGLEEISKYVSNGFYISADRAKKLISNNDFMRGLCNKLSQNDVNEKYKRTYRIIFIKLCELEESVLYDFLFNYRGLEKYLVINCLPESVIKLMFSLNGDLQKKILRELDTQEIYKNQLIESVAVDVICSMLKNEDQNKKANEILKLCLEQLQDYVLQRLNFSDSGGLDQSVKNSIIFSRIKNLFDWQIQQINLSQLDVKCVDLLLSDDYLPKLTGEQLIYLFSNRKDLLEKLTPKKILSLISNNAFIGALNKFTNKQGVLSLINFEKIINFVSDPQDKEAVVRFISQYINNLPNDKIISLLPSFFVKQQGGTAATQCEKNKELIRNKMSEVQQNNVLYKNIFKLRNYDFKNEPWKKLSGIFTEIKDVNEQKKLIRYLFMNYESYFVHLNALLGNIAPESSDSLEVSNTKKLVIEILKSSTEEKELNGIKIINKVVSEINLEDVSDTSSILSSVVKIFVGDLDVPSLKKVRFSELQTDMLQKLLKERFDDIPAEPYSDLILDFNLVEDLMLMETQKITKNDLKNLKQEQARIFNNIVAVNNFFIDRGIEESARIYQLQYQYPLWRLLSVDLVTAGTNITKLEGTDENGRQYTREEKLATMQSSLSDMYESLQECMSKLNKDNPIYSALADVQPVLKQWNEINDSIKPMDGVMGRFSSIYYNIGVIRKRGKLTSGDAFNLKNYIDRLKTMLEMFSRNDIKSKIKSIEAEIDSLRQKKQDVGQNKVQEIASLNQKITNLNAEKGVLNDAEVLQQFANKDEQLKDVLDKLKNQLEEHIKTLSSINGQDVIQGTALDNFLKSFDVLEKIKGELQAKTDPSNDKLLELYFGDFKDKLVSYCKVFKDMKLKGTLHEVLQSVEPKLIEMFTTENKPINYDVLRLDENLYYSKAKSYFFNQINRLKLNMSAIRKCLLSILLSVDKNNKGEVDKYNEIVKRFVQFNAGTDNTGDMEALGRSNFEFADEKGDVGSSLSVDQRSEIGIINMIKGGKEYTPDFMLKNLHFLVEYCSKINGADNTKYNELKNLGIKNLVFESVEIGKSKVLLENYFDYKNLFDNRLFAQLVFNTFRDIKGEQLENLNLRLGKDNLQMSNGVIAQNFYLLLEGIYNKTQNGGSIAGALSDLPIDDMKALAFLLGDWIAGNSDFYRKHGFNEICNIIKGRVMSGCQEQMINSVAKPKLNFTDKQINALVAHTFLISKKFSDRLDEIGKINSEDIYKKILPMLLEKDSNTKFTLEDVSTIQSYSVKTDYAYKRITDGEYKGKAIDHDRGHDVILDCFSQPLSNLMEYLVDNMDPKPSLADLFRKVHQDRLANNVPNGMWWQSIPKEFIKSELKSMFQGCSVGEIIASLKKENGFIYMLENCKEFVKRLAFSKKDVLDITGNFIAYCNEQIYSSRPRFLNFFLKLIKLLNPDGIKNCYTDVFDQLIQKSDCFDSGDIGQMVKFHKSIGRTESSILNCQQAACLILKGCYFIYPASEDNSSVVDYKTYMNNKKNNKNQTTNNYLGYAERFLDLKHEFNGCRCLLQFGSLLLVDYIKMINWFCYRDMFHMLVDGSIITDNYEPIKVSDNILLNYEQLSKMLSQKDFPNTNWNNVLDDLYKGSFQPSRDFVDSLDQLLKSSIAKAKDSDTFKDLPSRLCDVYSVFKIHLRECNSIEDIKDTFDSMRTSAPLKIAIDNKRISFSESKILTMKLLAALRAKENGIDIDSIVNIVENEKNKKVRVTKRGLTNKSFMTILQYLNENTEDQNYFDVQNKSLREEDFKKNFNLVVKYVMDNSDDLFPAATSESHSSDFNNVVSFLKHFGAVVPEEYVGEKINELTNKLNGRIKDQNASKDTTKQISGVDTTNVQPSDIQNEKTEGPAYVNTKSTQEPVNNDNGKTAGDTKVDSTINNPTKSTTDISIKNKAEITETDVTGMDSTSHHSTDDQDTVKTNEKTGMSYAIPVILTIINPILWLISACSGFPLPWIIGSGIATTVALVSWIIVILINLFADSPKDKSLHVLNEESAGQSMNFVKDVSRKNENVVGGPAQSCPDDKNKGKDAGPVQ